MIKALRAIANELRIMNILTLMKDDSPFRNEFTDEVNYYQLSTRLYRRPKYE